MDGVADERRGGSSPTRNYVVALIILAAFVSYIDRQVLTVLIEPMKRDLHLSDTSLGLLTGTFFSAFYLVAGIPLARWADVGNRRSIIAVCVAAYGLATAACGLAANFAQLAIGRSLVAVGEAGSTPASVSLISDMFPPNKRVRAFALMYCGNAIGIAFGIFLGGTLNDLIGWRNVFLVVGLPGVIVGALFYLTVSEPARAPIEKAEAVPTVWRAFGTFIASRTYWALVVMAIFRTITSWAVFAWMPSFLIRVHHMSTSAVGVQLGLATVVGLVGGNILSGVVAQALHYRDPRWLTWITAAALLLCLPLGLASFFAPSAVIALLFYLLFMTSLGIPSPLHMGIAVNLVPPSARALISATIPIFLSIGSAIGPVLVGFTTDGLNKRYGAEAVRYSLSISLGGLVIAALATIVAAIFIKAEYRSDDVAPSTVEAG